MARYSAERKVNILKKLLPPHNKPVAEVSEQDGIGVFHGHYRSVRYQCTPQILPYSARFTLFPCQLNAAHYRCVTTQRIHFLPQLFVVFVLNQSHIPYMLPLCVRKFLDLRKNINTLNSYRFDSYLWL